jgi:hypothetical protein
VSKLSLFPLAFALTIGIILSASGQGSGGTTNPGGLLSATPPPGSGEPSERLDGASRQKPDASDNASESSGSSEDVQDDTLTRLKTKDSLAPGAMGREEGQLTRKTRRRERVSEVESTKQLKTTGVDPKFQGSLLHSSVTSIEDVSQKASAKEADTETRAVAIGDPRFEEKHLVLPHEEGVQPKNKKEKSHIDAAESSPSPTSTPSPSTNGSKR